MSCPNKRPISSQFWCQGQTGGNLIKLWSWDLRFFDTSLTPIWASSFRWWWYMLTLSQGNHKSSVSNRFLKGDILGKWLKVNLSPQMVSQLDGNEKNVRQMWQHKYDRNINLDPTIQRSARWPQCWHKTTVSHSKAAGAACIIVVLIISIWFCFHSSSGKVYFV